MMVAASAPLTTTIPFYVSTMTGKSGSKGIYWSTLNWKTGALTPPCLAAEAKQPISSVISPNGAFLYAAMDFDGGAVGAFAIEKSGVLRFINAVPSEGVTPCHVSMDPSGRYVFVANYTDGVIACFAVRSDGSLDRCTSRIPLQGSGPDLKRQERSHAHGIYCSSDGQFVYVCDLGSDHIWSFRFNSKDGSLTPMDARIAKVPPGSGPRHLVFSRDKDFAYVANEMSLSVSTFHRNAATGALTLVESVSCTPEAPEPRKGVTLAEIALHPSGRWLYVSIRGEDLLSLFQVGKDGRLSFIENVPSVTATPSGMAVDPSGNWLLVAGKDGGTVVAFAIDQGSGRLTTTGQEITVPGGFELIFNTAVWNRR